MLREIGAQGSVVLIFVDIFLFLWTVLRSRGVRFQKLSFSQSGFYLNSAPFPSLFSHFPMCRFCVFRRL